MRCMLKERKWLIALGMLCLLLLVQTKPIYAADEETLAAVREELLEMLLNSDTTTHNVYDYQLTSKEIQAEWLEMIEEEGYLPFHTYNYSVLVFPSKKNGYSEQVYICGLDDGFAQRYPKLQACVAEVKSATSGMTTLEKVLYVHDYVIDCTVYDMEAVVGGRAGGPLGNGRGYCAGYTDAMSVLLTCIDVPCISVKSTAMNHAWNYVKINGSWYHLDATWDDTPGELTSEIEHYYFLRNDTEFKSELRKSHYSWTPEETGITSSSSTYSDWFVHDIIGRMFYYNGLWYYVDNETGNIVSSEVDLAQSNYKVRVNKKTLGASKLEITKVENGFIYYKADGVSSKALIEVSSSIIQSGTSTILGTNGSSSITVITPSTSTSNTTSSSTSTSTSTTLSWNSISSWRSGCYNWKTGVYEKNTSRICLNSYVSTTGGQRYQVKLSNGNCRLLVRELTSGKKFITSHELKNGDVFQANYNAAYLAISIYIPSNSSATYTTYQSMFQSGITVGLTKISALNVNGSSLKWGSVGYWRSGIYSMYNGTYVTYPTRVCLNDYVSVSSGKTYKVVLGNSQYHMLIREMTSNKTFIKSHNLTGGSTFTTSANTAYLAISLYMPSKDSSATFSDYQTVISSGPALTVVQ